MYRKTIAETAEKLGTDIKSGLTNEEVLKRRERDGLNEIEGGKREPFILKLARQFADVLIIILLIAAAISLIVDPSEWVDSLVILIVVAVNAVLGVVQESRAEKSLDALKKMSAPSCKVVRDGKTDIIPSSELVRGDIILVEAGDFVPADARLTEAANLQTDESALTGESLPVSRSEAKPPRSAIGRICFFRPRSSRTAGEERSLQKPEWTPKSARSRVCSARRKRELRRFRTNLRRSAKRSGLFPS